MVLSLLETIFITHLLHIATSEPPPMPPWLHSLLLHCTSPMKCCPTAPQKGNKTLGLPPAHLPGKEVSTAHTSSCNTSTSLFLPPSLFPSLKGDLCSPQPGLCLSLGLKEAVEFVGKVPSPQEAELNGCPQSARICQEDEAQKQHLVSLWVQFSHMMDTLLFCLYLLFMATSIITVIVLWNT